MKVSHTVCKKIKCSHYNQEDSKCVFGDCIFTTDEVCIKEMHVENTEFGVLIAKCAGATAVILLIMLMILKKAGFI